LKEELNDNEKHIVDYLNELLRDKSKLDEEKRLMLLRKCNFDFKGGPTKIQMVSSRLKNQREMESSYQKGVP